MYFLYAGDTEVGGFGLSAADNPLYVQDFLTVAQSVTAVSVAFDDAAVADHFDRCADGGIPPARCGRIWCHTHPGRSAQPSLVDEQTFTRVFGSCDWAVMFILSRTQRTYARLSFGAGPGGQVPLDVAVDWANWPRCVADDQGQWSGSTRKWPAEYQQNVRLRTPSFDGGGTMSDEWEDWFGLSEDPLPANLLSCARQLAERKVKA